VALTFVYSNNHLTLRSGPQDRVSKGGYTHHVCGPSFETAAARPPQDEVVGIMSATGVARSDEVLIYSASGSMSEALRRLRH